MPPSLSTRHPWRRRALGGAALLWACLGGPPLPAAAPETVSLPVQGPSRVEVASRPWRPAAEPASGLTPGLASEPASDPAAGLPSSGALLAGLALLALAAGGIAAAALLHRRGPSAPPRPPLVQRFRPPVARGSGENPGSAEPGSAELETLRRQERELEWKVYGIRGVRQPESIDVDDLRVRDEQGPEEEHG